MAYELTAAAATTSNPYAIVGAAIIDTARALAKDTQTSKGQIVAQNQLRAEDFSSYITSAIGQSGMRNTGRADDRLFQEAVVRRGVGTYAQVTAPTVTKMNDSTTKKKSIICTKLVELGELSPYVYAAGIAHWEAKNPVMISGYYKWAHRVAELCETNKVVRKVCGYFARSRYLYVIFNVWNFAGWLTVKVGEPMCAMIGDRNAKH